MASLLEVTMAQVLGKIFFNQINWNWNNFYFRSSVITLNVVKQEKNNDSEMENVSNGKIVVSVTADVNLENNWIKLKPILKILVRQHLLL